MALIDLGALVRAEHTALKNDHREATLATTKLHMQADECETLGDTEGAGNLRAVASEIQTSANKRWFRSN